MKNKNNIIILNLIIFHKLLEIFIFIILINRNFKQKITKQNKMTIFKKSYKFFEKILHLNTWVM